MVLLDLPNQLPTPNDNNLTSEAEKYYQLYTSLNRSDTGEEMFTSASSGKTYSTSDYVSDIDVYNKGQVGMMNLLYKYVLKSYIVVADFLNDIFGRVSSSTIDAASITYDKGNNRYNVILKYEPSTSIYSIRFKTPNNYMDKATFQITYKNSSNVDVSDIYTAVLSSASGNMPANSFIEGRVVSANVDKTSKTITFASATGIDFSSTEPSNKNGLWLDTSDGTLKYWDEDSQTWKGVVGVWG